MRDGRFEGALVASTLDAVAAAVPDAVSIAVDMPIGLPDGRQRSADNLARAFIGPRRSSVFMALPRDALTAADLAEARQRKAAVTAALARATSIPVIASGGLASIEDVKALLDPRYAMLEGAITGRALYDGRLDAREALALIAAA